MEQGGLLFYRYIPGLNKLPMQVGNAILVFFILFIIFLMGYRKLKQKGNDVVPDKRFTILNFMELIVELSITLIDENMGKAGRKLLYILGPLILFILFNNLSGLVPGFEPATSNLNTTLAMALTIFFLYLFYGFKTHGIKYLKHFMGPIPWLAPLMTPIEIIGHLARPMTLSLRLFGNMMGDHIILGIIFFLVPLFVPLAVMFLGIFVSVVQTLVFVLLAIAYFSEAMAEEEEY
jgi:F-type H+-transporting ATPase subunit a